MDEDMINIQKTIVAGITFIFYPDFIDRCTYAQNTDTKEIRQISWSGYINSDLTVRKAIAREFHLSTFRRNEKQLTKKEIIEMVLDRR